METSGNHSDETSVDLPESEPRSQRNVRPRVRILQPGAGRPLAWAVLVLALLLGVGTWWFLSRPGPGAVALAPPPQDTTATITFAGVFPGQADPPLANPLGIAVIGRRVFVAESDAGVIREFAEDGARVRVIRLPRASKRLAAYPADLAAVSDDALAVVDTASSRVFVVSLVTDGDKPLVLGEQDPKTAPSQPTAVARLADGIAVADGSDHTIKVYDAEGVYLRSIGGSLKPQLAFAGGMALVGGRLYVADSNAGRVIAIDPETGALVGMLPDRMQLPRGLGPADAGRLLVVSTFGRSLSLYDSAGTLVASITPDTGTPEAAARFVLPKGVAWMASTGRVYVSDAGDGRIRVYNLATEQSK
jgi:outer membrane protein assembly factor BamB